MSCSSKKKKGKKKVVGGFPTEFPTNAGTAHPGLPRQRGGRGGSINWEFSQLSLRVPWLQRTEQGQRKCVISGLINDPLSAFSLWNARGLTLSINAIKMGSKRLLCCLVLVFSQNAGAESRE